MSPAQILKINFWAPLVGILMSGALTAGVAYGIIGQTVTRNTSDIVKLHASALMIVEIRVQQGIQADRLSNLTRLVEKLIEK